MNEVLPVIGVIGGSGVYDIDALEDRRWERVASSFGEMSDEVLIGTLAGQKIAFLPRHGRGHRLPPSDINFRANIDGLKRLGVTDLISVSAVGSLREDLPPGRFVIVDQFIDRTFARDKSFFGPGLVGHVSMADPVCRRLVDGLEEAARGAGLDVTRGGTYLVMEGAQFSSRAESALYRSWQCDVIGMTNMPEAKLAREAEMCYASVAMITDYDCWHPEHDAVSVDQVIGVLMANAENARRLVTRAAGVDSPLRGPRPLCPHGCERVLDFALITHPDARDPAMVEKLDAIAGRVLR